MSVTVGIHEAIASGANLLRSVPDGVNEEDWRAGIADLLGEMFLPGSDQVAARTAMAYAIEGVYTKPPDELAWIRRFSTPTLEDVSMYLCSADPNGTRVGSFELAVRQEIERRELKVVKP